MPRTFSPRTRSWQSHIAPSVRFRRKQSSLLSCPATREKPGLTSSAFQSCCGAWTLRYRTYSETHGFPTFAHSSLTAFLHGETSFPDPLLGAIPGPAELAHKNTSLSWCFYVLVAGPGIEPGSGGYEPPEVPLLYPAMYCLCIFVLCDELRFLKIPLLVPTGPVQVV